MVLVLVILTLAFQGSWQQVSTEKTLNEMLDELIEETVISTFSNENNTNNSRIIYLKSDNTTTRRAQEPRLNSVPSSEYEDLENLVHQIKSSKHDTNYLKPGNDEKFVREITVEIERNAEPYGDNNGGRIEEIEIINDGFSKSGRPLFEDIPDNTIVYASESESNLIHNYPDIIIDKITYDSNENHVKEKENSVAAQIIEPINVNHFEQRKEVAAKALGSLMKLLIKEAPIKQSLGSNEIGRHVKDDKNTILKSTHIHNDYHNQVINNVPLAYGGLPSGKMLLGKLPEGYRDLHRIINRPRSAYLDPNMQLNRWGGNVGQNSLLSISRAHNMNRVHFIPKPLNIVSRFVYQPLFSHPQFLK